MTKYPQIYNLMELSNTIFLFDFLSIKILPKKNQEYIY